MPRTKSIFFQILFSVLIAGCFLFTGILPISPSTSFFHAKDKAFEAFARQVFCNEISGNTLNLHYTLADPSRFSIKEPSVYLGNADVQSRKDSLQTMRSYLNALEQFSRNDLSEENALTWDIFHEYLTTELAEENYLLYDEPLGETLGIQAQLPILLAEYPFRTKKDIKQYLALLECVPQYFSSIISYESAKADAGLFMSTESALAVASQCRSFLSDSQTHYLITTFNERIDQFSGLDSSEKQRCKKQNQTLLLTKVFPAYQTLSSEILSLSDKCKNEKGLFYLPKGKDYYQYLVRHLTGDERSVDELEENIKTQITQDYQNIQAALKQSMPAASNNHTPKALLQMLHQRISQDFPALPSVNCSIKYVPASLQNYLSPAFYLEPAMDSYQDNVIYLNPAEKISSLELFTMLAHEGFPGHLYQTVFFHAQNPSPLRLILDTGGFTEGWATYVEMYSYSLWDENPALANLTKYNRSFTLGIASLLDIGIHYHGYSLEETQHFLSRLGFDSETAHSLYLTILQAPANYLQYYVGYLNFSSLRERLQTKLGANFSLKDFHTAILETGPAPFSILNQYVENKLLR